MYLPIPPQPDCASAWREAVRAVDGQPGHSAYNVIIDVAHPTADNTRQDPRIAVVDNFLSGCDKNRWKPSRTPSSRLGSIIAMAPRRSLTCFATTC